MTMTLDEMISDLYYVVHKSQMATLELGDESARQLLRWLEDYKQLKEHQETIDPSDERFCEMLNSALRYALGRKSYIVQDNADYIRPLIPYLDNRTLYIMERDITDAAEANGLGMKIDEETWTDLWKDIVKEIEKRKE